MLSADEFEEATVDPLTGAITAITLTATATVGFVDIDFQTEGADNTNELVTTNGVNTVGTNTTNITLPKEDLPKYTFLEQLIGCACGVIIYYKDLNGEEWLIGTEGKKQRAYNTNSTGTSGRALDDPNQIDLVLVARGRFPKRNCTGITLPTIPIP